MKYTGTNEGESVGTAERDMSAVVVSMRMSGHAGVSGYDRLIHYLPCDVVTGPVDWTFAERALAKALKPLVNSAGSQWYHRESLIAELRAATRWCRNRGDVFHFLYGENSYRYLGLLKSAGKPRPIVCTYHLPAEKFHRIVSDTTAIKRLDAVVVVSTVQREIFSGLVGPNRIHYIPHGVDIEFFRPAGERVPNRRFRCLFVGSHLRDFDVFVGAVRALARSDIEFVVVTSRAEHHRFAGLENVTLLTGITDTELLKEYQSCDLFVLPVTDATTNNALLEAMACGAPVVATDLVGIRDYVDESVAILTRPADVSSFVDAIDCLYNNEAKRSEMARASRERAIALGWERVAAQVMGLYRELI